LIFLDGIEMISKLRVLVQSGSFFWAYNTVQNTRQYLVTLSILILRFYGLETVQGWREQWNVSAKKEFKDGGIKNGDAGG
jgi:hypothetical protein